MRSDEYRCSSTTKRRPRPAASSLSASAGPIMPRLHAMGGAVAQFVDRHLEPDQRAHAGDQRDLVDRLGQEIVGARFEAAHAVGRLVERGDQHDRQMGGRRRGSSAAGRPRNRPCPASSRRAARCRIRLFRRWRSRPARWSRSGPRNIRGRAGPRAAGDWTGRRRRPAREPSCAGPGARESGRSSRRTWRPRSASTDRPRSRPGGFSPRRPSSRTR